MTHAWKRIEATSNYQPRVRFTSLVAVRSAPILCAIILGISGCRDERRLELAAQALSKSADACLVAVRDHGAKYETCPDCTALSALSEQYIEAGGFDPQHPAPARIELVAERARTTAWMARATSASDGRTLSIW